MTQIVRRLSALAEHILKMWNQFLNDSRSVNRFDNTPVLILGNRHSGKRTFIDSLYELSKTELTKKSTGGSNSAVAQSARLRDKNLTSVIDYAYLNVINLKDPDNRTHSKLELFLIDDDQNQEVFEVLVSDPVLLQRMFVVIMLDFSQPWNFMTELNRWVTFLNQLLSKAGLTISQLDQMKLRAEKYYSSFNEPKFDEEGKFVKKSYEQIKESPELDIPIPEGVLTNNVRLPLIVTINKADLQTTIFREKNTQKNSYVQYHLRNACMKYGATLIYTSTKNNSNLKVFYEYILHRAYGFHLRFKSETVNEQQIFIPLGADNPQLLNDSIKVPPQPYGDVITPPVLPNDNKLEVPLIDDNEFFKKYESTAIVAPKPAANVPEPTSKATEQPTGTQRTQQLHSFYENLMRSNSNKNDFKRQSAQDLLAKHTSKIGESKKIIELKKEISNSTIPEEKEQLGKVAKENKEQPKN